MENLELSDLAFRVQVILDEHRHLPSPTDVKALEEVLEILDELQQPETSLSPLEWGARFVTLVARIIEVLQVLD